MFMFINNERGTTAMKQYLIAIANAIKATRRANQAAAKTEILPLMPNYSNRYKPTAAR